MANPAPATPQDCDIIGVEMHTMREPGARGQAAQLIRHLHRPLTEPLQREIRFGPGFTQVEMQLHPLLRSQSGRGAHQFGSRRAQGAWGDEYLTKRARPHVMETLYELGRVSKD